MRRCGPTALATLLAAVLIAPAAPASTVKHTPGSSGVGFAADPGEVNRVTVVRDGDSWVYADPGSTLGAAGDCTLARTRPCAARRPASPS